MDDIRYLKVFIKALTDKSILTGNPQATSLCLHASLFGELAKVYKTRFVEPFDRPRTSEKLYERIIKFMVADIFITGQQVAYNGCGSSMTDILEHSFPELLVD